MSEKLSSEVILPFVKDVPAHLEVEDVLTILRELKKKVCCPVVEECLQECCAEICYLTGSEGTFEECVAKECEIDLSQEETFKEAV